MDHRIYVGLPRALFTASPCLTSHTRTVCEKDCEKVCERCCIALLCSIRSNASAKIHRWKANADQSGRNAYHGTLRTEGW